MGGFSKITPRNYPTSPDIEDRRNENDDELAPNGLPEPERRLPELVIRSKPGYASVRQKRKQAQ